MSSPIYRTDDLDGALRYAPPRVRVQRQHASNYYSEPAADEPQPHDFGDDGDSSTGGHDVPPPMPRRHPLDPEIVPEPPPDLEEKSALKRLFLRLFGAAVIAAVVAWAVVALPGARPLKHESVPADTASAAISTDSGNQDLLRVASTVQVEQREKIVGDRAAHAPLSGEQTLPSPSAQPAAAAAPEAEPPPPATAQRPPVRATPALIIRQLDRDEVTHLLKRGQEFIASGDLAAARLVLQRAAEAGDVRAALALAGTFDPNLLAKLGKPQLADAALARLWYERAQQFGSAEAPGRLEQLATQLNGIH
jgi:hypothetical protein